MDTSSPVDEHMAGVVSSVRTRRGVVTPETDLVVASVPSSHVYVRHIAAETPDGVVRLADPDPDDPRRSAQERWWPPVMLSPKWVANADFDVFHVQFGFDAWSPDDLRDVVEAVHRRGAMLVHTVHDLRNPHHDSPDLHLAQLGVLVRHADAVLTLTEGAAEEIASRWGRRATVVPHPHVVDFATMHQRSTRPRLANDSFRVGLHVKSLRASMDPATILPALVDAVAEIPGAVLQVNGHRDVLEPDGLRYDAELAAYLRTADRRGELELHVHDFMTDDELWEYLGSLDVSVLPYRFGTHSGWLEACRDLGTAVIAPSCGYYRDQGPVHSYRFDEDDWDPGTLISAVHDAFERGRPRPLSVAERRTQRAAIAAKHRAVYRGTP